MTSSLSSQTSAARGQPQPPLGAALLAATWVAALEFATLATSAELPGAALGWLATAAFALNALALVPAALLLALAARVPGVARGAARLADGPLRRRVLAAVLLALSAALHVANARLYVRLYGGIHAALTLATLAAALLACVLLTARAPRASAGVQLRWLVLGAIGWLALAGLSIAQIASDEVLRAHALERTTVLDDELLAFDRLSGVLAEQPAAAAAIDPALLAQLAPAPVRAPSGLARGAHVVLITIDSMRADRWRAGGGRAQLPAIEALAEQSVRFARAYAPSCWTIHSMSAVFFARLPSQLRFIDVGVLPDLRFVAYRSELGQPIDPLNFKKRTPVPLRTQGPSLARQLRAAGYQTATVPAYIFYFRDAGLTADFEVVDEQGFRAAGVGVSGTAPVALVEHAARFLDRRDPARPFLLWLHFMEAHAPYRAPDMPAGLPAQARYDAALRYVDGQIGALHQALRARGLDEQTLFIVHADHGEEFGDHGGEFHATTLYEETVRVPLLVRLPPRAAIAPRRVAEPVSLLDLAPTLLDLLGVASDEAMMGRSLLPELRGESAEVRPLVMECERFAARKRAYLRWPFKLIVDHALGTSQLYALERDPRERDNLATREPALLHALRGELTAVERALIPRDSPDGSSSGEP